MDLKGRLTAYGFAVKVKRENASSESQPSFIPLFELLVALNLNLPIVSCGLC